MNVINFVKSIPTTVSRHGGRSLLILKKHSPEILTGIGIASGIASGIVACRSTLKVHEIKQKHDEIIDDINQARYEDENQALLEGESYSEQDAKKDKAIAHTAYIVDLIKLYSPAIGLGALSITCILGGHNIINKRNAALSAAYTIVQNRLDEYRQRVIEELGDDKDRQFLHGLKSENVSIVDIDENGKKKKHKENVLLMDPNTFSKYSRIFDETNRNWTGEPSLNKAFLIGQQNYMNDLLKARGHVFLNDVYDALGFDHSPEGQIVGWIYGGDGDNFIDFGIFSVYNQNSNEFVNGYEPSIVLDFNVDGVVFDQI